MIKVDILNGSGEDRSERTEALKIQKCVTRITKHEKK
jgi:hypothetical protein